MVYGRLDPRVLGCEALVSVGHHLLLLVAGPGVENVPHVQVVGVVRPAVPGQLYPLLPVGLHCGLVRQWEFSLDVLDDPEGADVEHGVGVVLVLDPAVQQLVVSALLPDQALEQTGGVEDVTGLQSQVLPDEGVFFFTFHTDLVSEGRTYLVKIMRQLMPDNNLTNIYIFPFFALLEYTGRTNTKIIPNKKFV